MFEYVLASNKKLTVTRLFARFDVVQLIWCKTLLGGYKKVLQLGFSVLVGVLLSEQLIFTKVTRSDIFARDEWETSDSLWFFIEMQNETK